MVKKQTNKKKQSQMTREYTIREGITVEAGNALQPGLVTCADGPQRSTHMAHDNISTTHTAKAHCSLSRAKAVMLAGPRAEDIVGIQAGISSVASILEHRLTGSLHVYYFLFNLAVSFSQTIH